MCCHLSCFIVSYRNSEPHRGDASLRAIRHNVESLNVVTISILVY